jgi:hypothetical protein
MFSYEQIAIGGQMKKRSKAEKEELWFAEFDPGDSRSLVRYRANQLFHVDFPEGVDALTDLSKSLFEIIPNSRLALGKETSDRDVFHTAVELMFLIVQLAMVNGRADLDRVGVALHAGLVALDERKRGFDEPLLRAARRSSRQGRDSFYVRQTKAWAVEAYRLLVVFGVKDAATQVAKLINNRSFLPPKRNGTAIVARSIKNWSKQSTFHFTWLSRPKMSHFENARKLWVEGKHGGARREVLRELSERLKEMKGIWMET